MYHHVIQCRSRDGETHRSLQVFLFGITEVTWGLFVGNAQTMSTDTTDHQPLQHGFALPGNSLCSWGWRSSCVKIQSIAFQLFLIQEIFFPRDVGWIDVLLDLKPLLPWFASLGRT